MSKKDALPDFTTLKKIDPKNKTHCEHWMRTWGVSATQLRAAFRNTRSTEVKVIERYLRERGAL